MTRFLAIVVVGLLSAVASACGDSSLMPEGVRSGIQTTETGLSDESPEDICAGLTETTSALYDWQEVARGNHVVLVHELLQEIESLGYECSVLAADEARFDVESFRERFSAWSTKAHKRTTRESTFLRYLLYALGILAISGFLMFWRRKYREA